MGSSKEHLKKFGDGKFNSKTTTLGAGKTLTIDFNGSGFDTANAKFFDYGRGVTHLNIAPTDDISLTHVNGIELDSPWPIGTNTFSITEGITFETITINIDNAATIHVRGW